MENKESPSEDQMKILNQVMSSLLGNVASAFLPKEEKEDSETSESEIIDDTVFVVRENGESLGFFYHLKDAAEYVAGRFDSFMARNSIHYLRTERESGSIRVYRKTPYLWFLYSEQCVLDLEVEEVSEISPGTDASSETEEPGDEALESEEVSEYSDVEEPEEESGDKESGDKESGEEKKE
jgi:hypothetical protein